MKDYNKLQQQANDKKMKLAKKVQKDISKIYHENYLKTRERVSKLSEGKTSQSDLEKLGKLIKGEITALNNELESQIEKYILETCLIATDTEIAFFIAINKTYKLGIENQIFKAFTNIDTKVKDLVISNKYYKDKHSLSKRLWGYNKGNLKDIDHILSEGIKSSKSAYQVAKDLEMYVNPKAKKPWDWSKVYPNCRTKTIDYNAQRLARTAISHSFQEAQKEACKKNPYVTKVKWRSAMQHGRTCELCKSRHNKIYDIDEVPTDHPNGICTTLPILDKSLKEISNELKEWVNGKRNPKLNKFIGGNK